MEHFKVNIHSIVDVITNSSTTIFTYQDSIKESKELVQAVLDISGIKDKSPDDIFYYGVFAEADVYTSYVENNEDEDGYDEDDDDMLPKDMPKVTSRYGTTEYEQEKEAREKWLSDLKVSIMKGEIEKPKWMTRAEENYGDWYPDSFLEFVVRDEKFSELAEKIKALLNSISADGGRDG